MRGRAIMKKETALGQIVAALAVVMLISTFVCLSPKISLANSGRDFVIVIDVSTSMQDIFEEVKQLTNRTLGEAKVGDNVAVITFQSRAGKRAFRAAVPVREISRPRTCPVVAERRQG
jgi:hypothetical protein